MTNVYGAHMRLEQVQQEATENSLRLVPVGALVLLKLTQVDKGDYPKSCCPLYIAPWVVVKRLTNEFFDSHSKERALNALQILSCEIPKARYLLSLPALSITEN